MKIHESAENYLETILMLSQRNGSVRSIDIANELNFSKPSISVAMKQFRKNGFISVADNGFITLTDAGMKIATKTYERHTLLIKALIAIGVSKDVATEDACKIEHDISDETFNKFKEYCKNKGII